MIYVCLVIPSESQVNNIGLFYSLKLLNLLWSKVGVVLSWINLESLSVDINICVRLFQSWQIIVSN
jgi:hypothetical protein